MKRDTYLYQKAIDYFSKLVIEHCGEEDYRLPTEMDACEELGVSRITVRRAYAVLEKHNLIKRAKRGGTRINNDLSREAILTILHSDDGASEIMTRNKTIAVIVPKMTDSYHVSTIVSSIIENHSDETVIVDCSDMSLKKEQVLIDKYVAMRVDGIILYPVDNEIYNPTLLQLSTVKYPLILVDRYLPGLTLPYVSADHDRMMKLAATYLLDKGHKGILYFNANLKTNSSLSMRKESFINTLYDAHNYRPYFYSFEGDTDPTSVAFCENFKEFLDVNTGITSVITADYSSGLHLSEILSIIGKPYRDRLEIVNLDFAPSQFPTATEYEHPTYIMQDSYMIGSEAIKLMHAAFAGEDISNTKIIVPSNIVQSPRAKSER